MLSLPVSDEQQAVGGGLAQQEPQLWCDPPSLLVPDLPLAQTLLQRPSEAWPAEASRADGTLSPVQRQEADVKKHSCGMVVESSALPDSSALIQTFRATSCECAYDMASTEQAVRFDD